MPLAVREGSYGDNYDIEAWLGGEGAGLAFRVKDKLNYWFVTQSLAVPGFYYVYLWHVENGQLSDPDVAWGFVAMQNPPSSLHVHIKASQDDLGVWVENGSWQCVIDPTTNGQNVLAWPDAGSVGLVAGVLASADCYLVAVGADGDNSHTLSAASEASVRDVLPTYWEPTHDAAGNLTDDGVYQYEYDAWNRLVKVTRCGPTAGPQVVAEYRYDGLGHRIYKHVQNSGDMNREEYFYYNRNWQLLEIDNADNFARQQFVWGTNYIDEAICMDVDTGTDGNCTDFEDNPVGARRFFHMQDANWNVVGLREGTSVVERYEYDPYGTVRICRGGASPGAAEQRTVTGQSLKWPNSSLPGNPVMYGGYFHDDETGWHNVRNRMYWRDRWMQRDPIGYSSRDTNLYQYAGNGPTGFTDPAGLTKCSRVCEDAKDEGLDYGDEGGVICCLGTAYSCAWPQNRPPMPWPESEKANAIFTKCVIVHEDVHQERTDCPNSFCGPVLLRPPGKGFYPGLEECMAFAAEVQCLKGSLDEREGDLECEVEVEIRIEDAEDMALKCLIKF